MRREGTSVGEETRLLYSGHLRERYLYAIPSHLKCLFAVTPETLLCEPIWHPCTGEPHALLKGPRARAVSEGSPGGVSAGVHPGTPAASLRKGGPKAALWIQKASTACRFVADILPLRWSRCSS